MSDHSDGDKDLTPVPGFWRGFNEPVEKPPLGSLPGWVDVQPWVHDEAWRDNMRRDRIARKPRVRFLWFERDMNFGIGSCTGLMWDKNPNATEGEFIYRRVFLIHTAFRFWIERS